MSRVGKAPIVIPQGVKVDIAEGLVSFQGPLGKMEYRTPATVKVLMDGAHLVVKPAVESPQAKAGWGSARAHLNNMALGVSKGWKRALEMTGVGYNAKIQGATLVLSVGFSHEVKFEIPSAIKCTVSKTSIEMQSCDVEMLGTFAAKIRKVQPPEPYLGKGIRYSDEVVRRKAGKTGKK